MTDPFSMLASIQALGATTMKIGQWLFSVKEGDIPVCHTRIMRVKKGLPWNEQIGVHPLEDGHLELTPIREEPEEAFDHFSRDEFYKALKKVSRKTSK